MRIRASWCSRVLMFAAVTYVAGIPSRIQAQDQQHVVSLDELKKDAAKPAELNSHRLRTKRAASPSASSE